MILQHFALEQQVQHHVATAIATRNEHSAAHAVLSAVCDVVFELDEKLNFMEHSPRLAGMLLLPPFRNLQGVQLQDFLHQTHDQDVYMKYSKAGVKQIMKHNKRRSKLAGKIREAEDKAADCH